MDEPTKETAMDKPAKANGNDNERGIGVVELLFAASTIGAVVVALAMRYPKLPSYLGD